MDEFTLINNYFKKHAISRPEIKFGIGDDCASIKISSENELLTSIDTLVSGVHFFPNIDPYDIAYKAVMVNISDCVAMGAEAFSVLLSLTLAQANESWLDRFAAGLKDALTKYNIALVGGDITRGPLTVTIAIQAFAPNEKAIYRHGAKEGDIIYVSGSLGLAAYAVGNLVRAELESLPELPLLKKALHQPTPRVDCINMLRKYATAAIDISDGLLSDLNHICTASSLGARLNLEAIPINPDLIKLVSHEVISTTTSLLPRDKLQEVGISKQIENSVGFDYALNLALNGGDDYEICFTVPKEKKYEFLAYTDKYKLECHEIGIMQKKLGIYTLHEDGQDIPLAPAGYMHFKDIQG